MNVVPTLSTRVRGIGLWTVDGVQGSALRNALNELRMAESVDWDATPLRSLRDRKTAALLAHAKESVPAYDSRDRRDLSDFPVVDKSVISAAKDEYLSRAYDQSDLVRMSTSGSTGTPFTVLQDRLKKKRVHAEVIHHAELMNYRVGAPFFYLRAMTSMTQKSRIVLWMQNQTMVDVTSLTDENIEKVLGTIQRGAKGGGVVLSYASTLNALADYFLRKGTSLATPLDAVISSSEILSDRTRDIIQSAFHCRRVSRYSNQENGVLGQDRTVPNEFLLNTTNYIFEILDLESDVPVEDGQLGRLVVTDLHNYAMPLIRYDTGDVASASTLTMEDVRRRVITHFSGRRTDLIRSATGEPLSPHAITNLMWRYSEIRQFQFIQTGSSTYLVKLNPYSTFTREIELHRRLEALLSPGAEITFQYVDEIPVLASGKRSYIVNQAAPEQSEPS